jgi:hypothetical protein
MQQLKESSAYDRKLGAQKSGERYPKGWTGEPGIWRAYFNDDNIRAYERIASLFVQLHPHAELLQKSYSDLAQLER